jgi:sec-independent protein translocase protein TatA
MLEGLFQPMHLIIVLGIALLFFGPKKLPELGKGLAEAIRGFKQAMNEPEETGLGPIKPGAKSEDRKND